MAFNVDGANDWLLLAGGIVGLGSTAWGVYQYVWPKYVDRRDRLKRERAERDTLHAGLRMMIAEFPAVKEDVGKIKQDWMPNGGGSPLDILKATARQVSSLTLQQHQQTAMLHGIAETMNDAVVWTDANGEPDAVTKGFTSMTGLDVSAMQNGGWRRMIHPDDVTGVSKAWTHAVEHHEVFTHRYRVCNVQHKDRSFFVVDVLAMPMPESAGWKAVYTKPDDTIHNSPVPMATTGPILAD